MTTLDEELDLRNKDEERKLFIDESLLKYTLTGLLMPDAENFSSVENPRPDLFTEAIWEELNRLTNFSCYEGLQESICAEIEHWERLMNCDKADLSFDLLPEPFQSSLPFFAWIPLFRCLKPELTTATIRRFVFKSLGKSFVTPPINSLGAVFDEGRVETPFLLILTPGNDPLEAINKLGEEKNARVVPWSLGRGMQDKVKKAIEETIYSGSSSKVSQWIVLQNCHLCKSFLPMLQ